LEEKILNITELPY